LPDVTMAANCIATCCPKVCLVTGFRVSIEKRECSV